MKFNGMVLAWTAIIMMIACFQTFAVCMVEEANGTEIGAEYYYSSITENAGETENPGEAKPVGDDVYFVISPSSKDETVPFSADAIKIAPRTESADIPLTESVDAADVSDSENESSDASNAGVLTGEVPEPEDEEQDYPEDSDSAEEEGYFPEDDDLYVVMPVPDDELDTSSATDVPENTENTDVSIDVSIPEGELFTVNIGGNRKTVDAYELVCAIVNTEISASSYGDEAIKAQAVAAYSYLKYHQANGLVPSVLVKYENMPDKIKRLVSEMWGVSCYYGGKPAQTVYSASTSGYTASSESVWGGHIPYLISVECPFDIYDPNFGVTVWFSEDDMRNSLEKSLNITLSDNPANWLRIISYVDVNYVAQLNVDGQASVTGRQMRENIMEFKLKSASFDVIYNDGYFVFTTYGYGHGVGMSQNGAKILAEQGYSYADILKYYFRGIEVY